MFKHRHIPVDDVLADHRVATHLKCESPGRRADTKGLDIDGHAPVSPLLLFLGKTGGDRAEEGNVHDLAAQAVEGADNLPRAGAPGAMLECAFADQRLDVIRRRRDATETEPVSDLAERRGLPQWLGADELKNLLLALGEWHAVRLYSIGLPAKVNPDRFPSMTGAESPAHRNLKRLALAWAQQQGYTICGVEVRLPHSSYRADVVAYRVESRKQPLPVDGRPDRLVAQPVIGSTVLFECKQARADFLKDSYVATETAAQLKALDRRRQELERLMKFHDPSLRKGESLFAEYDAVDGSDPDRKTYHRVMRDIERLQSGLFGKTKFDKVRRYACTNLCYLVVEPGVIEPEEVPPGWGVLVRQDDLLRLDRRPVLHEVAEPTRLALLQSIALSTTHRVNRELQVFREPVVESKPAAS